MIASPFALLLVGLLLVLLTTGVLHVIGVILLVVGLVGFLVGYPAGWYGRRPRP